MIEKDGPKIQKKILNDCLSNLYDKFIAEYPEDSLSLSSFCRMRSPNYLLINACLCTQHQNVSLKLKSDLKALKIVETHNPDAFIKNNSDTDIDNKMEHIAIGKISYNAWKIVKVQQGNGAVKDKMRLVKKCICGAFKIEISEFRLHVSLIKFSIYSVAIPER